MDVVTQYLQKPVSSECPLCTENVSDMDILRKHVTDTHFMSLEVATNLLQLIDTTKPEEVKKNSKKALEECKPVENLKTAINGTNITTNLSTSVTPIDKNETILDDAIDILREISGSNSLGDSRDYKDEVFSSAVCSQIFTGVVDLVYHQNEMGHLNYNNTPKGNCSMGQELVLSHELYLRPSLVNRPDSTRTSTVKTPEVPANEVSAISPACHSITSSHAEKTSVAPEFQTSANFQVITNSVPSIYPVTASHQFQFKVYPDQNNSMQQEAMNLMQPTSVEPNLFPLSSSIYSSMCSSPETLMHYQQLHCFFAQSSQSQITPNLPQVQQMHKIKGEEPFRKQPRLSLDPTESTPSPTFNDAVTTQRYPCSKQQKLMSKYRFIKRKSLTLRHKHANFGFKVMQFNKDSQRRFKKETNKKYEQKENNDQKQEQKYTEKENENLLIENKETTAQRQSKQHLKSISMGVPIPLNLGKNMNLPFAEAKNTHIPLCPPMMPPPKGPQSIGPMMPGEGDDPHYFTARQKLLQQQQLFQYRKKTRIDDHQLKKLRAYFDTNNSPTEVQLIEVSEKSGLPLKVIKRWFRNMLLKARQRNKAPSYNFNNPPSTYLNINEFEKIRVDNVTTFTSDKVTEQKNETITVEKKKLKTSDQEKFEEFPKLNNKEIKFKKITSNECSKIEQSEDSKQICYINSTASQMLNMLDALNCVVSNSSASSPMEFLNLRTSSADRLSGNFNHFVSASAMMSPASVSSMTLESPHSTSTPSSTPTPSCSFPRKRKNRTSFSKYQIKKLQEFFESNTYQKNDDLEYLSKLLNLSKEVIANWFKNTRQKARKVVVNHPAAPYEGENSQKTSFTDYQIKELQEFF